MTAKWVPQEERSSFVARSFMGTMVGKVITYPLCGILIDEYGWESAFYVTGSATFVWFVFWWLLVFDTPEKHPRISPEEKDRIEAALKMDGKEKNRSVPWRSFLTSVPLIALVTSDICNTFSAVIFFAYLPTYINSMLGFNIKALKLLSVS